MFLVLGKNHQKPIPPCYPSEMVISEASMGRSTINSWDFEAAGVHLPPTTLPPRPDPSAAEIAEPTELLKKTGGKWGWQWENPCKFLVNGNV